MSLTVAIAAGIGSALAYGAGSAGQHAAAHTGEADAGRLADLLRDPRWLLGSAGDVLGVGLQLVALGAGAVVLVQPLLVLSLPVAVGLRSWFGGPRPTRSDLLACLVVIAGLAVFFALIGEPHRGAIIGTGTAALTLAVAAVAGLSAVVASRRLLPNRRAAVIGAVAGCWFGVVSVLIEAVASVWETDGLRGFLRPLGLVPLAGVVILAGAGYVLVQIGFQLGSLGASFPPNLILDPVVAVVLGALVLNERVPLGSGRIVGYLACVLLVAWGAVRLAGPGRVCETGGPAGHAAPVPNATGPRRPSGTLEP